MPHGDWGEAIKASIVLKPGYTASEEEIIAFCAGRLASYKKPKAAAFVDGLPKTTTGKPLRRGLA